VIPSNACTLRITAAAGTKLAGAYSLGTVRVAPIVQYSPLLPPVGVWTVSQFQCGWSSSQTSYGSSPW